MEPDSREPESVVQPETPQSPVSVTYWKREVSVFQVFDHEFRGIKSAAASSGLYLTFFGIAFGAMLTLGIVLATVPLTSPRSFAAFVSLFALSIFVTAFFAIKAWKEYKVTGSHLDFIEERHKTPTK
jgi:hypothetical protein